MEQQTIEVHDVGPIDHISIPLPEGGGVIVFRGANGSGKSTAISAVDELARGSALTARARFGKAQGSIEGLGVRVSVGRVKASRRGELAIDAFEPRVDVARLVDPGIKDDEIADRYRVATACALAEISADADRFRELANIEWSVDTFDAPDLLTMAALVRRDLNAAALEHEKAAERAMSEARVIREEAGDVAAEPDVARAQASLERAIAEQSRLESERKAAAQARERIDRARADLDRHQVVDQAPSRIEELDQRLEDARQARDALARQLAELDREIAECGRSLIAERERMQAVQAALDARAAAQRAIDEASAVGEGPSAEDLAAASSAVEDCRRQLAAELDVARKRERLTRADENTRFSEVAASRARDLREAAARTDEVLSEHLAFVMPRGLRVQDNRLVAERDGRVVPFGQLSEGERWRIALDIAIDAMGEAGIVAIEQAAWEGLDGDARRAIHSHVKERGVYLFTAEADHDQVGPLRAEVFGEEGR